MDYYSNYGPVWHTYDMKPQISAPGGNILSTFPLGTLGGYSILSGTSMATPYTSGSFALIKSQFPTASIKEVLNLMQTTATPLSWIYDQTILSATAQQGAGKINVYDAIFSKTTVSPGQLLISDVTHTEYGTANITISNGSPNSQTYTLSHTGAGYTDYRLQYKQDTQTPNYGSATFSSSTVTIPAGGRTTISLQVQPPSDVFPERLPVFGGFIQISTTSETHHVPYLGPPYSLYNASYLHFQQSSIPHIPVLLTHNATDNSVIYALDFLEIDPSIGYTASFPTDQWTTEMRVDILPADTKITANHYGFNSSATLPEYQASKVVPGSKLFGYDSFGTIQRSAGSRWSWPAGNSNAYKETTATADDGTTVTLGNGDYRFYASVLRQGGTSGVFEDYDTYLGPVFRLNGA